MNLKYVYCDKKQLLNHNYAAVHQARKHFPLGLVIESYLKMVITHDHIRNRIKNLTLHIKYIDITSIFTVFYSKLNGKQKVLK